MRVVNKGKGKPEFTIVGSVHGDEPAGKKAIKKILSEDLEFKKPVKFIIANEEALEKDKRYLDMDLNRSFPGKQNSKSHEEKLAHRLKDEVKGTKVLDLHTTRSYPKPFATIKNTNEETIELIEASNIDKAVHFPESSGTLVEKAKAGIVAETGYQKSQEAVDNAVRIIKNFLGYFEVIDYSFNTSKPQIYKYKETVKGDWEFLAENFQKVEEGEIYAKNGSENLKAEEIFYPALMSTNGYKGMLGFKTVKIEN